MDSWHSYPSIYAIGHAAIADLLSRDVLVEEKVDGSQFSFGIFGGELAIRSKGAKMHIEAPERMFSRAAETVKEIGPLLRDGWTYRAEYLAKPKHNTLAYDRAPDKHLIIFDINIGNEQYLDYDAKAEEARRIGLEVVPRIFTGRISSVDQFRDLLDRQSILGGQKIEGVVVKPLVPIFGLDKRALLGKFVSEHFKEIHGVEWKKSNPTPSDVVMELGKRYQTPARWAKAAQHLREAGKLEGAPRDIGNLIKEAVADIEKECGDEIRQRLFEWAWPSIRRMATHGLPEWYKEELLKSAIDSQASLESEG